MAVFVLTSFNVVGVGTSSQSGSDHHDQRSNLLPERLHKSYAARVKRHILHDHLHGLLANWMLLAALVAMAAKSLLEDMIASILCILHGNNCCFKALWLHDERLWP